MKNKEVKQLQEIYRLYEECVKKAELAFGEAGVYKFQIPLYTMRLPLFKNLIEEDAQGVYDLVRDSFIFYLAELGYSQKQIIIRMGGNNRKLVRRVLKEAEEEYQKKIKLGDMEEVLKGKEDESEHDSG